MSTAQERVRALAMAQDFGAEALELNRQLVEADPTDAASRTRLGRCYLQAGRLDEAEAEYREVLRLDPKNRIAAGGLEAIESKRHEGDVIVEPARAARVSRPRVTGSSTPRQPRASGGSIGRPAGAVPTIFNGFEARDFTELQLCPRGDIQARFGPRVIDLLKRVNDLQSSVEISTAREPGHRQLFRQSRSEVRALEGQWFVHNAGARWEPQFNIGMYGGAQRSGDWLRIGLAFDLSERGHDADPAAGLAQARNYFQRFQSLLTSPRRSLFLGWMIKEDGRIEHNRRGPRMDLRVASDAADLLAQADPGSTEWVFLGKWLSPENPDDATTLGDPVSLVRTIDRVFAGLQPLWRAVMGL